MATCEGWLYLAGVLDACSRKIVGWAVDDTMPTALVARAFERAVASQRPTAGLLHHSDRGSQSASDAYRELRRRHGAVASMSRAGNGYGNAKMESFWVPLKTELIDGQIYAARAEARSAIFWSIEIFLLSAAGFTILTTEFVIIGLLPPMARDSVGDRSAQSARALRARILPDDRCRATRSDWWLAYDESCPRRTHRSSGKGAGETCHVERWNCTLRQRLGRFVRKTLSFSKCDRMHETALRLFVHRYNLSLNP